MKIYKQQMLILAISHLNLQLSLISNIAHLTDLCIIIITVTATITIKTKSTQRAQTSTNTKISTESDKGLKSGFLE